ncbi:hypothetical protein HK102_006315, partial [Quaeritorhiza haematococci]
MGYPMASNLRRKLPTSPMIIHDVTPTSTTRFLDSHTTKSHPEITGSTTVASSPREVAESSDVIVTMLPASQHVREVFLGKGGLLEGLKERSKKDAGRKECLVIDSSTIDVGTSKEVAQVLQGVGAVMVDAPVSGGTGGATAGTLTFMVGTPTPTHFEATKPYLQHMGKNIVHCGANGNGLVAKITNNMLLGISMIAASEAMNLGVRLGMDPKLLASILNTSSGRCWSTDTYNPCPGVMEGVPSSRDYEGGFGVGLMAKDMALA